MARATVLLADDHAGNAALLRELLSSAFDVVGVVGDGRALVREAERLAPDVIVSDVAMPQLDGIEAARLILAKNAAARVVLISVHADAATVERGLAAGALGYVAKQAAGDELVPAVHLALSRERRVLGAAGPGHERASTP